MDFIHGSVTGSYSHIHSYAKARRYTLFRRTCNVCSRIVPIKIHDLDSTDTELIENEMGCRLRAIEFIFSGAGVNRPLKPDDNPDKNINKTYYRDQIRKVANTVKEISDSIHPDEIERAAKSYLSRIETDMIDERPRPIVEAFAPPKRFPGKSLVTAIIILLVILVIIFIILKLTEPAIHPEAYQNISERDTISKSSMTIPDSWKL